MGSDIFSIEPVQLQFSLNNLKRLRVANNILILLTLENQIIRLDLKNPELVDKFKIKDKIKDIYLNHEYLIITTYQNTHYYLNNHSSNIHLISKLKNVLTSYIYFFNETLVLIGTEKGEIYQLVINKHKLNNSSLSLVWTNPINQNNNSLISGIYYRDNLLFIIQKNDIFYYDNLFNQKSAPDFKLLLNSNYSDYENFEAFDDFNNSSFFSNKKDFAWLIKNGIIFTNLKDNNELSKPTKLMDQLNYLLNIQLSSDLISDQSVAKGKSIMITEYHLIYLNDNHLTIVNKINYEIIFDVNLPLVVPNESYQGLSSDNNTYWIYTNYNIYELVINNESKNIWKLYLEKNEFEEAKKYTKSSTNLDLINLKYSNYLIMKKQYLDASEIIAQTSEYFEFACLDLFNDKKGLLNYLKLKLKLTDNKNYALQKIIISSLILEVSMEQIVLVESENESNVLQDSLKEFLTKNKDSINKDIAYQIFQNYNSMEILLFFGDLINDYEFILKYMINLEKYKECLKILTNLTDYKMVYKYSTILLINEPSETIYLWVELRQKIDCEKLIPAILNYNKIKNNIINDDLRQNLIIKYLKFLIFDQKVEKNIIHNTYLSIIILKNCELSKLFILEYFETMDANGDDHNNSNGEIYFDPDYILRLLLRFKQIEPAIYLYSMINDFECSIKLAIEHDLIDLACLIADKSFNKTDNVLRKKIWMEISRKFIQRFLFRKLSLDVTGSDAELLLNSKLQNIENMDILNNHDEDLQKLLEFLLGKCDLLTIQDLLPLFPEFQSINNFKKEIIKSLENYGIKLNQLNSSIQSSIKFNENLVENLKELQNSRHFLMDASNYNCEHCRLPVVLKKFISFPCHHNFHIDCILNLILHSRNQKFYKLKKQITTILKKHQISSKTNGGKIKIGNSNPELVKELEPLLCEKCLVCNDANIDSIEEGFITSDDKKLAKEWEL